MLNGRAYFVAPDISIAEAVAVRYSTAAAMIDCSVSTVRNLVKAKKLDIVLVGKDRRITTESIKRLARAA